MKEGGRSVASEYEQSIEDELNRMEPCAACYGAGVWEVECCSGAGGCSCRGGLVDMGACQNCRGRGEVPARYNDGRANADWLRSTGACFAGSGPSAGYWASAPALGYGRR